MKISPITLYRINTQRKINTKPNYNANPIRPYGQDIFFCSTSIYAVDINGICLRYKTIAEASKHTGLSIATIANCLRDDKPASRYAFIKCEDAEDEKGVLDKKIIRNMAIDLAFKTVYAVNQDGEYIKFASQSDASRELKISTPVISNFLNGKSRDGKGWAFAYGIDVERFFDDGSIVVDKRVIEKLAKRA